MSELLLPAWTILGFIAVCFWVLGSFFDKYLLERYFNQDEENNEGPGALLIFSAYFSSVITLIIFLIQFSKISFDLFSGLFGMLIGMINGLWILIYLYALKRSEVSKVVPIFQTIPIFGLLLGILLLGEFINQSEMLAAGGIIVGALILLHDKNESYLHIDVKTLRLMLTASFFVALSEVLFKMLAIYSNYWTAAFWISVGFTIFGINLFFLIDTYRLQFIEMMSTRLRQVLSANSVNEVLDNLAEFVFFFAITIGPVALVQSLNAYQPLFALFGALLISFFASSYIKEDFSKLSLIKKISGILIMTTSSIYLYSQIII